MGVIVLFFTEPADNFLFLYDSFSKASRWYEDRRNI